MRVIDAAHDGRPILRAVATGEVLADRVHARSRRPHHRGGEVADTTGAPSYLHPADRVLWDVVYPVTPDGELADGDDLHGRRHRRCTCCTPPATPPAPAASTRPTLDAVFTGDTLFKGGPGATGRSYSDFPTIVESIRDKLLTLPPETVVHTGHGDDTTIGAEAPHLQEWIDRGH